MGRPGFLWTESLRDALESVEAAKVDLFVNGDSDGNEITLDRLDDFIGLVRAADAELVKARVLFRDREFYPYYPESFSAEQDGLEAAAELLEGPLPVMPDGVEIDSISH